LLKYSNRRIVPTEIGYIYLPPWYIATLIFPNLFGAAYDVKTVRLFTALNVSHDHILYLGIAALAPLGYLFYSSWVRATNSRQDNEGNRLSVIRSLIAHYTSRITSGSRPAFFTFLAIFALFVMMTAPLYVHVTKYFPVLQTIRVIVRVGVLFLFAASALVAFGADRLLSANENALARFSTLARRFFFAALAFVLVAVAASYTLRWSGMAAHPEEKGKVAFVKKTAEVLSAQFTPPDMGILIPLICLLLVMLLLKGLASARINRRAFFACLVALLLADLFWNGHRLNPTFDSSRVFPRTEITDTLQSLPPGRVLVTPSGIETNRRADLIASQEKIIAPPNTLLPYQVATVSGKNQLFPKRYREFCSLIEPQPNLSHVVFEESQSPFFDLLNVRYVLTHASRPAPPGCHLVKTAEGLSLYENPDAMPRSFFVERVLRVQNAEESMRAMQVPDFNFRTTAVIEGGSKLTLDESESQLPASGTGVAKIVEERRNYVRIETENEKDGVLILSDNDYPGWRATVDGEPVEIFRANYTMRAVHVPAGRHNVTFEFAPESLHKSTRASLASAAIVGVSLIILMGRGRRRKRRAEE
ncbi:MAG TPA: YfhO family protein, partial [Blastocatellia bacterium]|nr:YfhO family protein [Blastocatellia bacterium]